MLYFYAHCRMCAGLRSRAKVYSIFILLPAKSIDFADRKWLNTLSYSDKGNNKYHIAYAFVHVIIPVLQLKKTISTYFSVQIIFIIVMYSWTFGNRGEDNHRKFHLILFYILNITFEPKNRIVLGLRCPTHEKLKMESIYWHACQSTRGNERLEKLTCKIQNE